MKRYLPLIGSVVTLSGSLGLVMFGHVLVGMLKVFTETENHSDALQGLSWAIISAIALVIGLIISSVVKDKKDCSKTGKLLQIGSGLFMFCGAIPLAWVILDANSALKGIALASSTPTLHHIKAIFNFSEVTMDVAYFLLLLSAVLSLVTNATSLQKNTSPTSDKPSTLSTVTSVGSLVVAIVLTLLLVSAWFNVNALSALLTTPMPQPSELAPHVMGIFNKSALVFAGLAIIGLLQLLTAAFTPAAQANTDPSD